MALTKLKTSGIADDAVTTDKLANAINTERTANTAKVSLDADSVTGAKIADDAIDSEHYTDGSIDTAHIAADQITGALIADDAVGAEHIEVLDSHLQLTDNSNIKLGTGDDLLIYHNGSDSYVKNSTGDLYIRDTNGNVYIQPKTDEHGIKCIADGAVELYHDNTKQCETAADGLAFPSGKGINFNATADASGTGVTAGSETLDDYEEGTFTPTWNAGGGVTFSYSQQYGWYTKIGDTVTFTLYLQGYASTITGGNENNGVVLQGLPFTMKNHSRYYPAFTVGRTYKFDINSDQRIYSYGEYNSTQARFIMETDDSTGNVMVANQLNQNTCEVFLNGTYKI